MKSLISSLILCLLFSSCKSTKNKYETKVSEKEIYEFMSLALNVLKISDTVSVNPVPIYLFRPDSNSNGFEIIDFVIDENRGRNNGIQPVLNSNDTIYLLNQNKRYFDGFKWNLRKLGYTKNNSTREVYFSIPFFTEDRKSAFLYTSYNDKIGFMSGGSSIWYFENTESGWKSKMIRMSLN